MIGCTDDKPRRCAEANTTVTVKPTSRKEAMDQASKDIEESTNSGDVSGMRGDKIIFLKTQVQPRTFARLAHIQKFAIFDLKPIGKHLSTFDHL